MLACWKKLNCTCLLALGFCLMQCLCGCVLFQLFEVDEAFPEDTKAEWYEAGDPKIRSGLVLQIGVMAAGMAVVNMSQEVNHAGNILFPLVGAIKCEGLTLPEVQEVIAEAYKEFVIDPEVTVSFGYVPNAGMKSPWGSVLMMGAVGRNGPVDMPSTRDMTVMRALMLAGEVSAMGDKTSVRVARRLPDGSLKRFKVDIEKMGRRGRSDWDIPLYPGDVVWVPETVF